MLFYTKEGEQMLIFNNVKWITKHIGSLQGKRIALFGATGGIGKELAAYILRLGGGLITVDRNPQKSKMLQCELLLKYPDAEIHALIVDLEDMKAVDSVCSELVQYNVDVLIHNAGAYSIPRRICDSGFDNVFQINFVSPYYITRKLMDHLAERRGSVVVVGSIAHNYSKINLDDVDFRTRKQASLAYGNAKRFWMYSAIGLAKENPKVRFSIAHPGITFTNITAHYPKWLFSIIKYPMKIIFMPPRLAALNILLGTVNDTPIGYWIGPRLFDVWGKPSVRKLRTATSEEQENIHKIAKNIYKQIQRG